MGRRSPPLTSGVPPSPDGGSTPSGEGGEPPGEGEEGEGRAGLLYHRPSLSGVGPGGTIGGLIRLS